MDIFHTEVWKTINENLKVSSFGNFESKNKGLHKYDYQSSNGHLYELVDTENGPELFLVEELIAKAFIIPGELLKNKPLYVRHIDNDFTNNFVGNLLWDVVSEVWLPLKYPKVRENMYEISNFGRVRNIHSGIILRQDSSFGYKCYGLAGVDSGAHAKVFAHCLVAKHFVPGRTENKNIVNHIKRDRSSCNFLYLEWVSQSENVMHGVLTGATNAITTDEADMIRDMLLDLKYKGNPSLIYNDIDHEKYPNIKRYTISMIKQNKQCRRSNKYDLDKIAFPKCKECNFIS